MFAPPREAIFAHSRSIEVSTSVSDGSARDHSTGVWRSLRFGGLYEHCTLWCAGSQLYANVKAYGEFAAHNRPSGFNTWLTLSFSPLPPTNPKSAMLTK
jgi:hypothetical protein